MKMPTVYTDDALGVDARAADGLRTIESPVYSVLYPPVGFFPFSGVGNGDYFGFYWPIGKESDAPIVAFTSHDAHSLIPEYGSLPGAAMCQAAICGDVESAELRDAFEITKVPVPGPNTVPTLSNKDHKELLELDPTSPFRNVAVGDMHLSDGNLDAAEHHYLRSIALLPEYTAAHFGLAYLYRRLRRTEASSLHLRLALLCPLAFWGGSFWADHILPGSFRNDWARKTLYWLQQIKTPDPSLVDDPLYRSVGRLSLKTGLAKSEDVDVLMSLTDAYEAMADPAAASLLWMNVGERGAMETTAFRERYALTPATYATRLSRLWRSAGFGPRADLLDAILMRMKRPDGHQL